MGLGTQDTRRYLFGDVLANDWCWKMVGTKDGSTLQEGHCLKTGIQAGGTPLVEE